MTIWTIGAAVICTAIAVWTPLVAQAAPLTEEHSVVVGGERMTERGVDVGGGGPAPASQTVEHPEGGTWWYGLSDNAVFSNFYHGGRRHGSSAMDGDGHLTQSTNVAAGATSYASRAKTWFGNSCYYRFA